MMDWDIILYAFVCSAMLTFSALGLESALITPSLNRWNRRFFIVFFGVLTLGSATVFLELIVYINPDLVVLRNITYFIQTLFCAVSFPMLAVFLLHWCEERWRKSPLFLATVFLFAVFFILLVISQFTTLFYYTSSDNQLRFGPAYPLLLAPLLAMLILIAVGVIRRRRVLPRQYYRALLVCLLPMAVALSIHAVTPVFTLVNVGLVISAFSMYRIIVFDSVERDQRHQQEIANQRARIAVLQMRPHFIYNTMTSIYYLCDQDPQLAKQVTMDFTTYLRKNLAAIASEDTVPFSEELEHTRAYLAVEQAQFEDDLLIDYDTSHTQFRVPPLTLQPIVENAVKHGMDPDSGPLHVWVRTREIDGGSEVVVEDDGPGFDPSIAERPHTTLANIRQRLDMMCGGTLDIAAREGGGTVMKVTVPRRG